MTMTGVFAAVNCVAVSPAHNYVASFSMSVDSVFLFLLAPSVLIGLVVGPFAGRFAPVIGYGNLLRIGNAASAILLVLLAFVGVNSKITLIVAVILLGINYAGFGNIVLNILGEVKSLTVTADLYAG